MRLRWVALFLAAMLATLHISPLWSGTLIGGARTDVLRAVWGFDHQARALPGLPFWTDRVGFPVGVKLLILPLESVTLGAPLHWLFGAIRGYDLWILALWWATAVASAALVRGLTGSGSAGLLAGGWMLVQPSMLLSISDGTPEYVAFWAVPLLLLLLHRARGDPAPAHAIAAGIVATAVALDSPYHAVFAVPLALPMALRLPRRNLTVLAVCAALGGLLALGLYWGLPLAGPIEDRGRNAARLTTWWQWEAGAMENPWEFSNTPTFIPLPMVVGAVGFALLRPLRSLPWLGLALLCLILALGTAPENGAALGVWMGGPGHLLGAGISWFNEHLAPELIRFPRRWLIPSALCLCVAGGIGLARLPSEVLRFLVALALLLFTARWTLQVTRYADALPELDAPDPEFASFIESYPGRGAILVLPRVRGAKRLHQRDELPVFANLGSELASADTLWIQVRTGRPAINWPDGLFTLQLRSAWSEDRMALLRDLDDLAKPQMTEDPIPESALQEPPRRAQRAANLVRDGLRFVIVDEDMYGNEGMVLLERPFADVLVEKRHFDDGSGVTVFVLAPKG
jgi:hypothetical protein